MIELTVGDHLPAVGYITIGGQPVVAPDGRRPTAILLLDAGCPACSQMTEDLGGVLEAIDESDLNVLYCVRAAGVKIAEGMKAMHNWQRPVIPDPERMIFRKFATSQVPRVYLADIAGKIVFIGIGIEDKVLNGCKEHLDALLRESVGARDAQKGNGN
jgi:hypothetical protein